MGSECQKVRQLADRRKWRLANKLDRLPPVVRTEIELGRLYEPREIYHAQQHFIRIGAHVREHRPIVGVQELERPSSERAITLSHANDATRPFQERSRQSLLRLDTDRLKPIHRV